MKPIERVKLKKVKSSWVELYEVYILEVSCSRNQYFSYNWPNNKFIWKKKFNFKWDGEQKNNNNSKKKTE